ncbi:serine/threonine-protein kinase [Sandaracinus amylolyticus]|uniref:non-specific serine/threonine protein kinase n=1 Tax=Sandaracinus amylolyticus TaxID=927083 RepID=A0A0F6YLR4_9BACT|nr:serine/threonine-protein kinase [Sandaracinus amylolyticus]AKF09495.1 Serine/threonine protein kinase [Sandaracinus amylolyticus]
MAHQKESAAAPKREGEPALRDPERLIGQTLGGKYRVTGVIARGGMGRIYRAEQVPLGRPVALKVLHSALHDAGELDETGGDPGFQKRFLLEAASCARLRHPNIVVVYDYGRLEESSREAYFMAMELIEGPTLGQVLRDEGPLAIARALRITREVARALREAHRQEMVHRDLKPSNVMLVTTGEGEQVKVLDFGLVKVMRDDSEELTKEGHFLGSPKYMAPEQIRRGPVDGRADLYALGVLLYQMISGRVPFEGDDPVQTLMAHLSEPVPPITSAIEVPHAVQQLVLRCLQKDPAMRFASAEELIRAIDEVAPMVPGWSAQARHAMTVSGEVATMGSSSFSLSLGATAPPPPETVSPPARAQRGARIAIVAGVAIAAGLAAIASSGGSEPEATTPAASAASEAPPPAPIDPPAAPRFTLFVASTPPGATLRRGDEVIGSTPTFVELDRAALETAPVTFRVELDGHAPYVWTQGPSTEDVHVSAALAALPPPAVVAPPPVEPTPEPRVERRRRDRDRATTSAPSGDDFAIKTRR